MKRSISLVIISVIMALLLAPQVSAGKVSIKAYWKSGGGQLNGSVELPRFLSGYASLFWNDVTEFRGGELLKFDVINLTGSAVEFDIETSLTRNGSEIAWFITEKMTVGAGETLSIVIPGGLNIDDLMAGRMPESLSGLPRIESYGYDESFISEEKLAGIVAGGRFPEGTYTGTIKLRNYADKSVLDTDSVSVEITNPGAPKLEGLGSEISEDRPTFTWSVPDIPTGSQVKSVVTVSRASGETVFTKDVLHGAEVYSGPVLVRLAYPSLSEALPLVSGKEYTLTVGLYDIIAGRMIGTAVKRFRVVLPNAAPRVYLDDSRLDGIITGDRVTFSGSASDPEDGVISGRSLTWKINGQEAGWGENIEYVFADPGSYTLRLEARDSQGELAFDTRTVLVRNNTSPTVTIDSPTESQEFEAGSTVSLSARVQDSEDTVLAVWWESMGQTIAQGAEAVSIFNSPGWYNLKVTAQDSHGAQESAEVRIKINPRTEEERPHSENYDESPEFTVLSPEDNWIYDSSTPVSFVSNIPAEWVSDVDGTLGTGNLLRRLSAGDHMITAKIDGQTVGTLRLTVVGQPPRTAAATVIEVNGTAMVRFGEDLERFTFLGDVLFDGCIISVTGNDSVLLLMIDGSYQLVTAANSPYTVRMAGDVR